jgi:nucleoside-diphosphate-sugar epimerase
VDLCDSVAVAETVSQHSFDYVVITLTPGERSEARYHAVYVEGTRNLLAALQGTPRLLFVSSTSVYAQDRGEWVDERSPALGSGFSGRCLREAEDRVSASGFPFSIVRFSGIYGPGRERLIRMVRENRLDWYSAAQWSNRIHVDDCASVLSFLIQRWQSGISPSSCYVASDLCPVQLADVWQWLASCMSHSLPIPADHGQIEIETGKRCRSELLQSEGFCFKYPDYKAGYSALLG